MTAAVQANLDGVDVEFRQGLLEILQHSCGQRFAVVFLKENGTLGFTKRGVEGEDVVCGVIAGIVADGPVSNDEVGEGIG